MLHEQKFPSFLSNESAVRSRSILYITAIKLRSKYYYNNYYIDDDFNRNSHGHIRQWKSVEINMRIFMHRLYLCNNTDTGLLWIARARDIFYLIDLRVADSVVLHTQVTHSGHELERMQEETGIQQEGEDVRPLKYGKNCATC